MSVPGADKLFGSRGAPPRHAVQREIALAVNEQGVIPARGFLLTRTGLIVQPDATEDDWWNVGSAILQIESASQWLMRE
jgi:hypothetical protein